MVLGFVRIQKKNRMSERKKEKMRREAENNNSGQAIKQEKQDQ